MEKLTILIAFITTVILLILNFYYFNEGFIGSQYNTIIGYFPQGILSDKLNNVNNLPDCMNECDKDNKCYGFLMTGTNCWKFKDTNFPTFIKSNNPGIFNPISGIKQFTQCDLVQQMFGGKCSNNDFPGNDLLPTPFYVQSDSLGNCVQNCLDTNKCVGISYDTKRNRCFYKTKMNGNGNPAKDRISWISLRK